MTAVADRTQQSDETREIRAKLGDRIHSLCEALWQGGHVEGREWVAPRRAQGGPGDALKVVLHGPEAGSWFHHGAREGGGPLDLIMFALNTDFAEAKRWARRWLGLGPGESIARTRRPEDEAAEAERRAAAAKAEEERELQGRKAARAMWLQGHAELAGTPVDWYLRGRGIDIRLLAAPPRALRYHPALNYPWRAMAPDARGPDSRDRYPAMAANVCDVDGNHVATHRTYLEIVKPGAAVKARTVPDAKLSKGKLGGGLVRLARGEMVHKETGLVKPAATWADVPRYLEGGKWQSEAFETVYIAEGIENALTLACACPARRVAAAVSLANMASVRLPEFIGTVVLIRDNDGDNAAARRGFARAFHWFRGHGKRVLEIAPPEGVKDLNDYWQQQRAAS